MLTIKEMVELRLQHQIAHEIYRQQIMQRIPDPFPPMLTIHHAISPSAAAAAAVAQQMLMPPGQPSLPGCEAKLENKKLWQQFHKIGTEMIITKSGRRMFPSMRISLSGLEEEENYCVLLEMVPIGDCRYKFSGSQWVPAGGPEPQSPQRMYVHPDSPATGKHWQSQALLFNKVKLTNNTLDSSGHIVLASMHKYQPRLHVIRTSDFTQLPWAPQESFLFPETEFIAVTAYQNDRITKLKIDNNPFAKGFRETGQSRCKRKVNALAAQEDVRTEGAGDDLQPQNLYRQSSMSSLALSVSDDDLLSVCSSESPPQPKRLRTSVYRHDEGCISSNSNGTTSPRLDEMLGCVYSYQNEAYKPQMPMNFATYITMPTSMAGASTIMEHQMHSNNLKYYPQQDHQLETIFHSSTEIVGESMPTLTGNNDLAEVSSSSEKPVPKIEAPTRTRRNSFSISAILAY